MNGAVRVARVGALLRQGILAGPARPRSARLCLRRIGQTALQRGQTIHIAAVKDCQCSFYGPPACPAAHAPLRRALRGKPSWHVQRSRAPKLSRNPPSVQGPRRAVRELNSYETPTAHASVLCLWYWFVGFGCIAWCVQTGGSRPSLLSHLPLPSKALAPQRAQQVAKP